ncbi:MAG: DUF222 domain-containing protein, partial [Actinobacteria bacterium]|nr:DUF222 domain-containing protein [Actinomycetota bacterium]
MSTLRSCLEEMASEDPAGVDTDSLESDYAELERASRVLEALKARVLAELDQRRAYLVTDGCTSTSSWLTWRHNLSWSEASWRVRACRALQDMPATRRALGEGEVSSGALRVLIRAREHHPEAFSGVEEVLVGQARSLGLRDLDRVARYWAQAVDPERVEDEAEEAYRRRWLHASPTAFGMVRVDGELDPENGQVLLTAIRAAADHAVRTEHGTDYRTPAQRRADALSEVCRAFLDSAERPTVATERPHVVVTVSLDALRGPGGGTSELEDVGPITPGAARRWACDSSVSRVLLGGASEPLDVGRRTPVVPSGMRRALGVRDSGCRFPGCDRPRSWCDAHHVIHWADGGPTA